MKSPSGVSAVGIAPGKPAASVCGLVPAKRRRTYGMPLYSKYPVILRVKYDCITPCRRNGFSRGGMGGSIHDNARPRQAAAFDTTSRDQSFAHTPQLLVPHTTLI